MGDELSYEECEIILKRSFIYNILDNYNNNTQIYIIEKYTISVIDKIKV